MSQAAKGGLWRDDLMQEAKQGQAWRIEMANDQGIGVLLPHLNEMRSLAWFVALRARLRGLVASR